jgi:hypothetical protein
LIHEILQEVTTEEGPRDKGWDPPEQRWIKVNTNAGFGGQTEESSAGVVIRGESGKVLLTAWQLLRRCAMVEEAEAEACLRGPKLTTGWSGILAIIERKRVDDHGLEREHNGMGGGA